MIRKYWPLLLALGLLRPEIAQAEPRELRVGRATEHLSMDPHFSRTGNNFDMMLQVYDQMVASGADMNMAPALATGWKVTDGLTWDITLRDDVRFHDGSPLTAADVAFSLQRVKQGVPGTAAGMADLMAGVAAVEVVDATHLRVRTAAPLPLLMRQIGSIFIIPAKLGADVRPEAFNSGQAAIGSGPYRFVSWQRGDRARLAANPDYWGAKAEFSGVTARFITNNAARVAALIAGEVDMINNVQPVDVASLQANPALRIWSTPSLRLVFIEMDTARDVSPFITDKAGKAMAANPLRDVRVRRALSMMIDRKALVSRVLLGYGAAAGQMMPPGQLGSAPDMAPDAYDPAAARALLAEAGWPDGFGITLHAPSDRIVSDVQTAQAIGQMFARGGIKMNAVELLPYATYLTQASEQKFSAGIFSWSGVDPQTGLVAKLATYDRATGMGAINRARYSNAAFDVKLRDAISIFDDGARYAALTEATRMVMRDRALLPLYWLSPIWASRAWIKIDPSVDETTSARFAHPLE